MTKGLDHYSLNQIYEMEYKELVRAIETPCLMLGIPKSLTNTFLVTEKDILVSIAGNQKKNCLQNQPDMKKRSVTSKILWMPLCENIIQKTIIRMVQSKRVSTNGRQQKGADV